MLFIVVLIGCNENITESLITQANEIQGQLSNWNNPVSDSLFWNIKVDSKYYTLASTTISNTGKFSLDLPIPPSNILENYQHLIWDETNYLKMVDDIEFSDSSAKYISLSLSHYEYEDITMPIQCGSTRNFTYNSIVGDYQIHYYYFDKTTVVNGTFEFQLFENAYPMWEERTIITQYNNVNFKNGWNQVKVELLSINNGVRTLKVDIVQTGQTYWSIFALENDFVKLL